MEFVYVYVIGVLIFALINLQKDRYDKAMILANNIKKSDPKSSDVEMSHTAMIIGIAIISIFWPVSLILSFFLKVKK